MEIDEITETLEGCVSVLNDIESDHHDARLFAVMTSLKTCVEKLDEMDEPELRA